MAIGVVTDFAASDFTMTSGAPNIARLKGANGKTDDDLRPSLLLRGGIHDLRARACSAAYPDRKPASHPNHCRHARGRGKTQTPEKAETAEDRLVHWPSHDSGRARAEEAPLRYRPSSSFTRAAQRGIAGRSRHRCARPERAGPRRLLARARSQELGLSLRRAGPPPGFCRHPEDRHAVEGRSVP